jgi:hypothetical protein
MRKETENTITKALAKSRRDGSLQPCSNETLAIDQAMGAPTHQVAKKPMIPAKTLGERLSGSA